MVSTLLFVAGFCLYVSTISAVTLSRTVPSCYSSSEMFMSFEKYETALDQEKANKSCVITKSPVAPDNLGHFERFCTDSNAGTCCSTEYSLSKDGELSIKAGMNPDTASLTTLILSNSDTHEGPITESTELCRDGSVKLGSSTSCKIPACARFLAVHGNARRALMACGSDVILTYKDNKIAKAECTEDFVNEDRTIKKLQDENQGSKNPQILNPETIEMQDQKEQNTTLQKEKLQEEKLEKEKMEKEKQQNENLQDGKQKEEKLQNETKQQEKSKKCFPAEATVELLSGKRIRMDELSIGDHVRVGAGDNAFAAVFMFTHKTADSLSDFVRLEVVSGATLSATAGHLIYANGKLTPAGYIRIGDELTLENGEHSKVSAINFISMKGLYNPQTTHGDVVVGGILASTYTTAVEEKTAHACISPLRAAYKWLGTYTGLLENGSPIN